MEVKSYQNARRSLKVYLWEVLQDRRTGFMQYVVKAVLWLGSLLYGLAVRLMCGAYETGFLAKKVLPRPVISVGNLTLGGSGKTPLVVDMARYILSRGGLPAILARGYHAPADGSDNDEVLLLKALVPEAVLGVGRDRFLSAQIILRDHPQAVFIMDDGFQHWRLGRDLDILCLDAGSPFGNGFVLPRGMLREPKSAVSRADVVVLTKTDQPGAQTGPLKEWLKSHGQEAVACAVHEPLSVADLVTGETHSLGDIINRRVCALSSIGRPESFLRTLETLQARVVDSAVFMNHEWYSKQAMSRVLKGAREQGAQLVLTTEKDAVKLARFKDLFLGQGLPCWIVKITLKWTAGQEDIYRGIDHLLQR